MVKGVGRQQRHNMVCIYFVLIMFHSVFQHPTEIIKLVMESVCIMLGQKPVRKNVDGKMVNEYWDTAQKVLGDMKFLEKLKTFDKDNIPAATIEKIRKRFAHICISIMHSI